MRRTPFPTPFAGAFYPIYNSGPNQYLPPSPDMPLSQVSALFIAFAHAYPQDNGAVLLLEQGQPEEPQRVEGLVAYARNVNPDITLLISLGWEHNDWSYINQDYQSGAGKFARSVVELIRRYKLDGFDIDDEGINGSSGYISQENFDAVIASIRSALDNAARLDGKPYFLTITPAFGQGHVSQENMRHFDLINCQNYGGTHPDDFTCLGYPRSQISWGVNSENCGVGLPDSSDCQGLAGIFNWTLSADSLCSNYQTTRQIAKAVGYVR